jgi:Isocitrate/isopropylmalate dehydrogenase
MVGSFQTVTRVQHTRAPATAGGARRPRRCCRPAGQTSRLPGRHISEALAGSLGIAPTCNIDPERRDPSMFEPIHGSAFDIMGQGLANPMCTFWSVVVMLAHLVGPEAARLRMAAIERVRPMRGCTCATSAATRRRRR